MMINSDKIINCTNLSKKFGYFFALKNISFDVRKHTIFGIAGANGAGKTTLIKILSGLLRPTFGKIEIDKLNYNDHSNIIKQNIGIITDESFLFEELTIFENLKYYSNLHFNFNKNDIKINIERLCDKFNLIDWINEPVGVLSHGMKQKVELIRVLIHNPSIIFLDEPFSGLDYKSTNMLIEFLKELRNKVTVSIILTTHNTDVLKEISDEVLILKKGKISKFARIEENIEIESYF
ncbi:MAG: ABC transporter ATP-binding protein [Promethearchaeota archaeon]